MATSTPRPTPRPPATHPMPGVVTGILLFFYALGWITLIVDTGLAISLTTDGNYAYLLPVALYVGVLVSPVVLNRRRHRQGEGNWSDRIWGFDDQVGMQVAFILASFALIAWMTALVPNVYSWFYLALWGQTLGMLGWRIGVPLLVLQVGVWAAQIGLLGAFFTPGGPDGAAIGTAIGVGFFFLYLFLIVILLKSRVRSEILVQELRAAQVRLEAALAQEKEVAVLRERDRMAREMHDVLGHALVLVAVKIEAAQRLQAVDPPRAAAELEATKELVRQSMADLRTSLADLRSPALEAGTAPLSTTLQEWATRIAQEGGFVLTATFEPGIDSLPAPSQDALWRVGREAILNVVKHARAKRVELHLFCKEGTAYLSVGDDGVGIPHLAEGQARLEVEGHYGVRGMRERVEALGGRLQIRPNRDGRGTLVLASLPLPPADETPASRIRARLSPARALLFRRGEPS